LTSSSSFASFARMRDIIAAMSPMLIAV
jgi:hypothetical protein